MENNKRSAKTVNRQSGKTEVAKRKTQNGKPAKRQNERKRQNGKRPKRTGQPCYAQSPY